MAHAVRLNLRMQKELKLLMMDPPPGVSLLPVSDNNGASSSSLSNIEACIEGPEGTVYAKGVFHIRIQVPERYPFQPPNVTFITPIYHPNIDNGGRICLDILNLPPKGAWQPSLNIATVLTSIGLLLSEPNPDDGLMCETSREYKYNRQQFDQNARAWTEKYAKAEVGSEISSVDNSKKVEAATLNVKTGDKPHENVTNPKKGCLAGKVHLKPVATVDRFETGENVQPSSRLSLSHSLNLPCEAAKSVPCQHSEISSGNLPILVRDSQAAHESKQQLEQGLKITETMVVSDSEESEEENRPTKFRVSLRRERMVGKWKSEKCS